MLELETDQEHVITCAHELPYFLDVPFIISECHHNHWCCVLRPGIPAGSVARSSHL